MPVPSLNYQQHYTLVNAGGLLQPSWSEQSPYQTGENDQVIQPRSDVYVNLHPNGKLDRIQLNINCFLVEIKHEQRTPPPSTPAPQAQSVNVAIKSERSEVGGIDSNIENTRPAGLLNVAVATTDPIHGTIVKTSENCGLLTPTNQSLMSQPSIESDDHDDSPRVSLISF